MTTPMQIAAKSIRRSRSSQQPGPLSARSIGGWKSGSSGWAGYGVQMVVRSGSKPLIFVRRRRVDHRDLSLSFVVGRAITQWRIRLSEWLIVPGRAARARRHRSEALGQWLMWFD
jgi:hypothetical protein